MILKKIILLQIFLLVLNISLSAETIKSNKIGKWKTEYYKEWYPINVKGKYPLKPDERAFVELFYEVVTDPITKKTAWVNKVYKGKRKDHWNYTFDGERLQYINYAKYLNKKKKFMYRNVHFEYDHLDRLINVAVYDETQELMYGKRIMRDEFGEVVSVKYYNKDNLILKSAIRSKNGYIYYDWWKKETSYDKWRLLPPTLLFTNEEIR